MRRFRIQVGIVFGTCLLLAGPCLGQERFESGRYIGFTKYSAFAIVELQDPFTMREAKGVIQYPNSSDPLPNVLVEFRDTSGKIKATKTDSHGQFRFHGLREGTYMFKTTLVGFQSVVGTIVVRRHVQGSEGITIKMPLGV